MMSAGLSPLRNFIFTKFLICDVRSFFAHARHAPQPSLGK